QNGIKRKGSRCGITRSHSRRRASRFCSPRRCHLLCSPHGRVPGAAEQQNVRWPIAMVFRSYVIILLLATSGCFAQSEAEETRPPIDTLAIRLNNEAVEAMSEILTPRSPADTAAYRDIIAQFQRAYRLDTTYTTALMNASVAYASLGEWDSTIVVLERGLDKEPGFAELIGYYRMHLGQPEEAQRAFEHALDAVEASREEALGTLTGFEREAY